ncbi:MAG TPA: class I lanthipeptide [Candidatus Kapabacteria bacterium]|nr:class I lanthipeptide [Candidatus Kapabacteria bacterium]
MKTKNFKKKLTLNKQTLTNLDQLSMQKLKGGTGETYTDVTWETMQTLEKLCYMHSCVNCTWLPVCGTIDC